MGVLIPEPRGLTTELTYSPFKEAELPTSLSIGSTYYQGREHVGEHRLLPSFSVLGAVVLDDGKTEAQEGALWYSLVTR